MEKRLRGFSCFLSLLFFLYHDTWAGWTDGWTARVFLSFREGSLVRLSGRMKSIPAACARWSPVWRRKGKERQIAAATSRAAVYDG